MDILEEILKIENSMDKNIMFIPVEISFNDGFLFCCDFYHNKNCTKTHCQSECFLDKNIENARLMSLTEVVLFAKKPRKEPT
ncbi:MAG: hypothetical protein FWD76_05470 [Firmicutes bacterium]|nr:hypothetical protein [Bacillota bacterium]